MFLVVIARETMMLARFRRGQSKQTTIKLYLCFVSPTLLARGRDPLSVKRFRQNKYSVSTRMKYVQTELMNYYSPFPHPIPVSSNLCLIVAFYPSQTPILLCIQRFLWVLLKQYLSPSKCHWYKPMASWQLLPVNEHDTISAPGRQYTLLTGSLPIQQGRHKSSRKGWPRLGAFAKATIPSCAAVVVVMLYKSNWHPWFWRRLGDNDHGLMWGCEMYLVVHLAGFLMCEASHGEAKWWRN